MTSPETPTLYPYDTYLYAATPRPREDEWLGWDRYNFGFARFGEMALSLRYRPEWEIWRRVRPRYGHKVQEWAALARKCGYHVVYPLAHADTAEERQRQAYILRNGLRFFERRNQPDGEEALRHRCRLKTYRGRDPVTKKYIPGHNRLRLFPEGIPSLGMDLVLPNLAWEKFKARGRMMRSYKAQAAFGDEPAQLARHQGRPRFPVGRAPAIGTML